MIKLIQKFFSKKRNVVIVGILFVIFACLAGYTISSIQDNVRKLSEAEVESPTYFPQYPKVDTSGKSSEQITQIARGEYLVKAGDCISCHTNTPEKGPSFAGGLPLETPFGTIYSPNITPDKATGIGNWTDAQFIKAMREGISPQGHQYYPAFPYLYFNKVTTEDLISIKAYLNNLPAVNHQNRDNKMVWPFNWRFLQSGWRMLFFLPTKTGPFVPDPKQTEQWNRGAYLVEGLGHCAMCHTPSYYIISKNFPLGAPMREYNLTGSKIQGYLAPNITKANLSTISTEELVKVFTHNQLIGGGKIEGPMLEANQNSLQYLTGPDLLAIATYLKSVQSKSPPLPKPGKGGPGKPIYESYCVGCHATGAGGAPKYGDAASWSPILKQSKDTIYSNAIKGIGGMPAKGTCYTCSDTDIKQAVDYMITSVTGKTAKMIPPVKKLTLEDGKGLYDKNCSICHSTGFKNAPIPGDKQQWKPIVDTGFIQIYDNVVSGRKGHPPRGACADCSDDEIKAALKYMLTVSSNNDYSLW